VVAAEIDDFAGAAIAANAALSGVEIEITTADVVGTVDPRWEVITAGDVCYEQPMAGRVADWLRSLARSGRIVMLGDPGRAYLPADGLCECSRYVVPTSRDLEDRDSREGVVWRVVA
jgi:predicted nicotinamide N-methyase